ncbi:uncharacterized protein LOC119616821 [Kryptolebias marmoratus]|uniref:uncharacterized protein LOC119616821 n=1 Tax=Kryptolebias marmoratus TaxID=37003 RepID=UPI0018ACC1D6|nr:uncharacterized protein LOC119616821 [Kryptolebias marmoratus]
MEFLREESSDRWVLTDLVSVFLEGHAPFDGGGACDRDKSTVIIGLLMRNDLMASPEETGVTMETEEVRESFLSTSGSKVLSFCSDDSGCVNAGTGYGKLVFGPGTGLKVQNRDESKPEFYKLEHNGTRVCLATGFSRHNATKNIGLFNGTQVTQYSSGIYSQVAFLKDSETGCNETETEDKCEATVEPDPMVNLAALTVSVLRVIFLKTVVFNVLMTLRLWISQ